ncbi:hypothetical protein GCM10010174_52310 [Kutzneria viridogrisea]|uniref:Glutathione synthase/RimK-type ligase-like ATP-grasp enzyme n=1 Tax=Kutzneria viridogrisea TaxID=47990 RepID=A0ABR6BYM1_9PSEU|nr:glutathione synthase/RimK-type ligase-like ATP-grasp enzyme [Kutzneria viridogrisea]
MHICVLSDTRDHPTLTAFAEILAPTDTVEVLDPSHANEFADPVRFADVYLLKSRSARAVALGHSLRRSGGVVVNDPVGTANCQHRLRMARRATAAGLPFAPTHAFTRLSEFVRQASSHAFPVVVKSTRSRRADLVAKVDDLRQLRSLEARWAGEPVVVQEFLPNDGWDYKLWAIGEEVFLARRRSRLDPDAPATTHPVGDEAFKSGLRALARRVGETFSLLVHGVDVLLTARGPIVVDINAFPGCRGVSGAAQALAALVHEVASRRAQRAGTVPVVPPRVAPTVLPALHRAVGRLVSDPDVRLRVSRVRRKPGQGLVVSYAAGSSRPVLLASLAEHAAADPGVTDLLAGVGSLAVRGVRPTVVELPSIGLTVRSFPCDEGLPGLPAALGPVPGDQLSTRLADACRLVLDDPSARVVSVRATPIRYKPGSRCVIRYQITAAARDRADLRELVVYGKVYRDLGVGLVAHRVAEALWCTGMPFVARPLAVVRELDLVLSEAAGGADRQGQVDGNKLLSPHWASEDPQTAVAAVAACATALARLHVDCPADGLADLTCGATYARRARGWAAALAGHAPGFAGEMARLSSALVEALRSAPSTVRTPVHGAFKPSQVVFCGPTRPVVIDFDGTGLGDPALDQGYFLAYLRPRGRALRQAESGAWCHAARQRFLEVHLDGLLAGGLAEGEVDEVRRRAHLYEAAVLLKIASRHSRRVASPRPRALHAALAVAWDCLRRFESGAVSAA